MPVYATAPSQVPQDHWALVFFSTIHIPGDERSRTNPGHGYPAHNKPVVNYVVYDNEEEWRAAIAVEETRIYKRQYVAIRATRAHITKEVKIAITN